MSLARHHTGQETGALLNRGESTSPKAPQSNHRGLVAGLFIVIVLLLATVVILMVLYVLLWLQNPHYEPNTPEGQKVAAGDDYKSRAYETRANDLSDAESKMLNYITSPCKDFYEDGCLAWMQDPKLAEYDVPLGMLSDVVGKKASVVENPYGIHKSFNEISTVLRVLYDGLHSYITSNDTLADPAWFRKIIYFNRMCLASNYSSDKIFTDPVGEIQNTIREMNATVARYNTLAEFFASFYQNYSIEFPISLTYVGERDGKPLYYLDFFTSTILPEYFFNETNTQHYRYMKGFSMFLEGYLPLFADEEKNSSKSKQRAELADLLFRFEGYVLRNKTKDSTKILNASDVAHVIKANVGNMFDGPNFTFDIDLYLRKVLPHNEFATTLIAVSTIPMSPAIIDDPAYDRYTVNRYSIKRDDLITYLALRKMIQLAALAPKDDCIKRLISRFPTLSYWIQKARDVQNFPKSSTNWNTFAGVFTKETVEVLSSFSLGDHKTAFAAQLANLNISWGTPDLSYMNDVYNAWMLESRYDTPLKEIVSSAATYDTYKAIVLEYLRFDAAVKLDPSRALLYETAPLFYNTPFYVPVGDKTIQPGIYVGDRFLMPPFIEDNEPYYMDIGRLGMLLGHELAHVLYEYITDNANSFTDTTTIKSFLGCVGREYKKPDSSWTPSTLIADISADQLIQAGSPFTTATLREAFADQVGLLITYNVYNKHYLRTDIERDGLFERKMLFYYAVGTNPLFCNAPNPPSTRLARHMTSGLGYSELRLNRLVQNAVDFNVTFYCGPHDVVNRSPKCIADLLHF